MTILSITIGTKTSAVIVLKNKELIDHQTHNFRGAWSPKKAERMMTIYSNYFLLYCIDLIVVKVPPPAHHSKAIKLILKLLHTITPPGCMVDYTTKKELKTMVNVKNTTEMKKLAVQLYPQLKREYCKSKRNKQPYYRKLFEAVVTAHVWRERYLEKLD